MPKTHPHPLVRSAGLQQPFIRPDGQLGRRFFGNLDDPAPYLPV